MAVFHAARIHGVVRRAAAHTRGLQWQDVCLPVDRYLELLRHLDRVNTALLPLATLVTRSFSAADVQVALDKVDELMGRSYFIDKSPAADR